MEKLNDLRTEIDFIDAELVKLLEKRMNISLKIGEIKIENDMPIFDPKRENEIIENRISLLKNKKLSNQLKSILDEIMYVSKSIQMPNDSEKNNKKSYNIEKTNLPIAYQGREGGNGHEASVKFFGENARLIKKKYFEDVLISIQSGESEYGVLPVENSFTGTINDVLDILNDYNCKIVGETYLPVQYCLLAKRGAKIENIKKVISHIQAMRQCSKFIKDNNFEEIIASNTAEAAYIVSTTKDDSIASISNKKASEIYYLDILKENIENEKGNTTRFIVVSNYDNPHNEGNKMTIRFSLAHERESLSKALIHLQNMNLTSIVSRPYPNRKWQYYFYVDMVADWENENIQKSFSIFKENVDNLIILGRYRE